MHGTPPESQTNKATSLISSRLLLTRHAHFSASEFPRGALLRVPSSAAVFRSGSRYKEVQRLVVSLLRAPLCTVRKSMARAACETTSGKSPTKVGQGQRNDVAGEISEQRPWAAD